MAVGAKVVHEDVARDQILQDGVPCPKRLGRLEQ